jgi:hypothetical protein
MGNAKKAIYTLCSCLKATVLHRLLLRGIFLFGDERTGDQELFA